MENAFVESFQGRFRDECLNLHWFKTLQDARETIETWRIEYNTERGCTAFLIILLLQNMQRGWY